MAEQDDGGVEDRLLTDGGVKEKFRIEVNDEVTLSRDDQLAHADHGPMSVAQITISALGKRARLRADARTDGMSIEMSGDEIREAWGETLAADPFELHEAGVASYEKTFTSHDDEVEVSINVSGPERRGDFVMAYLDDSVHRVLQAFKDEVPPEETEGKFTIDWESIFSEDDDGE